jgi:DNA-binding MarR family transcriptional regulator/N-acetylglutamate synthase-like GNAT family acetyltransferase
MIASEDSGSSIGPRTIFGSNMDGIKLSLRLHARILAGVERRLSASSVNPTQRRILLELLLFPKQVDAEIALALGLERSQLSRSINPMIERGLIAFEPSANHARQRQQFLTDAGLALAAQLTAQSEQAIDAEFAALEGNDQQLLLTAAISTVRDMAGKRFGQLRQDDFDTTVRLREPKTSDWSWMFKQVEALKQRYGWLDDYDAYVARELRGFLTTGHSDWPSGWVAERHYNPIGMCLPIIHPNGLECRIGWMFVEPSARKRGIGTRLFEACRIWASNVTLSRMHAEATERQRDLDRFYRRHGMIRSRRSSTELRFGIEEQCRRYRLDLGVDRTTQV